MPRPGITYEQVAQAANILVEQGNKPTIQRIRDELGTGSPNTIHCHLRDWKLTQAPVERNPIQLPDALIRAIADEIERQVSATRAEVEAQAQESQQTADTLAEIGEELEAQVEQLLSQVSRLEGERDDVTEERDTAQAELERLRKALDEELLDAEKNREALIQAETRIKLLSEQRDEYYQTSMETQRKLQAIERLQRTTERAKAAAEAKQAAAEHNAIDQREALKAERQARKQDADAVRKEIAQMRNEWKERLTVLEQGVHSAEQRAIAAERARSKVEIQLKALKSQDGVRPPGKRRLSKDG